MGMLDDAIDLRMDMMREAEEIRWSSNPELIDSIRLQDALYFPRPSRQVNKNVLLEETIKRNKEKYPYLSDEDIYIKSIDELESYTG